MIWMIIICNSQYTKKNILAIFPIDEKKISVISPPVDFNYFNLQNIKFENYYFISSRHEKNKRIANIIEAFKKIDFQLIISSSGSQTKFLKKISINYENIKFVGVLTENKYDTLFKEL